VCACTKQQAIVVVEEHSDQAKIYNIGNDSIRQGTFIRVSSNFISHRVTNACILDDDNLIVVSSEFMQKFYISIYNTMGLISIIEQIQTISGQRLMAWNPKSRLLTTVGTGRGDAKGHVITVYESKEGFLLKNILHKLGTYVYYCKTSSCNLFV